MHTYGQHVPGVCIGLTCGKNRKASKIWDENCSSLTDVSTDSCRGHRGGSGQGRDKSQM